jgi:cytochrome c6
MQAARQGYFASKHAWAYNLARSCPQPGWRFWLRPFREPQWRYGMKNLLIKSCLLLFVLALVLPAFSVAADSGAELFATKCAACHAKDGSGNTAMGKNLKIRDLGSADVQKQSDKETKEIVTKGKGKMPAYSGKLTDTQIDDLVKFIRSLKK